MTKEPKTSRSYRQLTPRETWAVVDHLNRLAKKTPEGVLYELGWSDDRVAKEAIPDFPGAGKGSVAKIRIDLFGQLANIHDPDGSKAAAKPKPGKAMDRLAEAESRILRLEFQLSWVIGELKSLGWDMAALPEIPTSFVSPSLSRSESDDE